jgi:hypothetical protein
MAHRFTLRQRNNLVAFGAKRTWTDRQNRLSRSKMIHSGRFTQLFDDFVRDRERPRWDCEAQRFSGLEVDHKLELCRLQHR